MVLSSLMFLLDPLLMRWLIDEILPKKDFRLLLFAVGSFFALYVSRTVSLAFAAKVSFATVQKLVFRIRLGILEKMNCLSAEYHETTPIGERVYRIEQDVDQVADLGSSLVPYVLQTAFNSVFVVGAMLMLDFRLTCVVLPLAPLFLGFKKYFEGRLRQASDSVQQESTRESCFLQEHLASVIQIQLLHQEDTQIQAFLHRANARMKTLNHRNLVEILFRTCYMAVIALGTIGILAYGGYELFAGALTVGGLVAFYSYLGRLFDPLNATVDIYSRFNRLGSSIRRILEVLEMKPSVPEQPGAIPLINPLRDCVEMKDVGFSYRNGPPVLEGVNLKIKAGEKIALVGISGSGKSTVTKLISRLYDVNAGAVCIDGIDVRNFCLRSLRTRVCYLMQDAILFDRTLKENLLLGKQCATKKELLRAIEMADLDDLLGRLSKGWDTPIGPRGNALSGGERQRVALARAVLQAPSLLLLDESTSALDAPGEQRVFANLAETFRRETIVFISHRISALKWVDRIVVLHDRAIEEQGTHDHLMNLGGLYKYLCNIPVATAVKNVSSFPANNL